MDSCVTIAFVNILKCLSFAQWMPAQSSEQLQYSILINMTDS